MVKHRPPSKDSPAQAKFRRLSKELFRIGPGTGLTIAQRKARFTGIARVVRAVLKGELKKAEAKRIVADFSRGGVFRLRPFVKELLTPAGSGHHAHTRRGGRR